jgi:hypothetical protein
MSWESPSRRGNCLRGASSFSRGCVLALVGGLLLVVAVEAVLVDVVHNLVWDVVADALAPLPEEADLGGGYVVLDELWDHANVVAELLEAYQRVI